jgi:AcrR family transcriptional regulator
MPDSSSPSTGASPRWERRKADRPAELIAAALDLFVKRGYAGTRLDDVAARAKVSKGTLYLYFSNKEDLFKAVVRENVVALIRRTADHVATYEGSSEGLLRTLVDAWWQEFGSTRAGGISKLMVAESGNFPEIARFFLDEVIEPWHALLASALERGIARGEFRAVDTGTYVRVMTAPLVMLSLWKHSFAPCSAIPLDPQHYLATLLDTHLRALLVPAPATPGAGDGTASHTRRSAQRKA